MRGLIVDLRFNPGGLLTQSVEMCNRFMQSGLIVETRDSDGRSEKFNARMHRASDVDEVSLVVLVNEGSASASEIVAGCLKDHERAIIVGTRTYGKGSVQKVRRIAGGKALLRLTGEHWLTPSGAQIHRSPGSDIWGVDPHVLVRMTPEQVADTIMLRQECDILFGPDDEPVGAVMTWPKRRRADDDDNGAENDDVAGGGDRATPDLIDRNPDRLIHEAGYDVQLKAALLLLQSKVLPEQSRHADLTQK
jgi:carboxyl-terminal processing protease